MSEKRIAKIAVSAANYSLDKPYDYLIPDSMADNVVPGMRVTVPFSRGLPSGGRVRHPRHGLRPRRRGGLGDYLRRHGAFNVHHTAADSAPRSEYIKFTPPLGGVFKFILPFRPR